MYVCMYVCMYVFTYFKERGREGEREKHQSVLKRSTDQLPLAPNRGPATQACALTRNQTGDL